MSSEKIQTVFLLDTRPIPSATLQRYCRALSLACIRILLFLAQFPNKEHLHRVRWNYNFFNSHRPERSVRSKTAQFYENRSELIEKFFNELHNSLEAAQEAYEDPVIPKPSTKQYKPAKLVYSALASAAQDFAWDAPEILSPVRQLSARDKSKKNARGRKSDNATDVPSGRNVIFICGPCPQSETDLLHFCHGGSSSTSAPAATGKEKKTDVLLEVLQSELLPSALVSQLAAKGIAVHWLDTSSCLMQEGCPDGKTEEVGGCSLMSEALRIVGGAVMPIGCLVSPVCSRLIQQALHNRSRRDEQSIETPVGSDSHTTVLKAMPTTHTTNMEPACHSLFQGNQANVQQSDPSPKSHSHSTFQENLQSTQTSQEPTENLAVPESNSRPSKSSLPPPELLTTLVLPAAAHLGEYLQRCVRASAPSPQQSVLGLDNADLFWLCSTEGKTMCILEALPMHHFVKSKLSTASASSTPHGGESQLNQEKQTQERVYAVTSVQDGTLRARKPNKWKIKKKLSFSSADKPSQRQKKSLESGLTNEQPSAQAISEAPGSQAQLQGLLCMQEPTGTQPQLHPITSDTQTEFQSTANACEATSVPHAVTLGVIKRGEIPLTWLDPTNVYSCVGLYVPRTVRNKSVKVTTAVPSTNNQQSTRDTSSVPKEVSESSVELVTSRSPTSYRTSPKTPKTTPAQTSRSLSASPYERALRSSPQIRLYRTPPKRNSLKRLKRSLSDGAEKVPRKSRTISQLRRSPRLSAAGTDHIGTYQVIVIEGNYQMVPQITGKSTKSCDSEVLVQTTASPCTCTPPVAKLAPQAPSEIGTPPTTVGASLHLHDGSQKKTATPRQNQERRSHISPTTPKSRQSRPPTSTHTPPLSSSALTSPENRRKSPRIAIRGVPNYHKLLKSDTSSHVYTFTASDRSLEEHRADTQQPPSLSSDHPVISSRDAPIKRTSLLVHIPLQKLQPSSQSSHLGYLSSIPSQSLHPLIPSSTVPSACTASQQPQTQNKDSTDPRGPLSATAISGGVSAGSYQTLCPGESLAQSGRYLSRQFQSLCLWLARNGLLLLVGINPASPSPRPACVGVLQPVTSLVATLTLVRPQHHARLLERLGATSSLAPGPKRQDFLAHLRTTREGRGSEMDADRNFAAPAVDDQTVRVKKVAVGGPKSTAMLFLEDVFSSDKKQREVPTLSTDRRRREDPALSGQGSPQANDVSTSHSAEASGGTSEEQFVVRYASDSELYASLQLLFRSSRQPADANLHCALLQSALEVSPFSPLSLLPWFPYLQACGVSHCTVERLRELQLDSRVDGEASSRNHRRRELLSALREACTPRGSRTQPAGKEGEGVGQSEGEGEAMETDGPVSQPEVEEKEVVAEELEPESKEPERPATVEELFEHFHSEYEDQVKACHDGEALQVWAAKAVSRLQSDFHFVAANEEVGESPSLDAHLWECLHEKVLLDSRRLREKYEAMSGEGGSEVQERVAEYQLQVLLHCEAMRVCTNASYDSSTMAEQLVLLLRRVSLLTYPGLLGHCLKELILPNYADNCRAVLAEVYEGLMLPLPSQLHSSPDEQVPNPTGCPGNSSGEEESPIKSLEEPQAPKHPQNTAKSLARHTSFHDIQVQRQITVPKRANKRKKSKASKDDLDLKTRRFSPRLKKLSEEGLKVKGVCRSLFSRSHSVSYEGGHVTGTKRKREQDEVEKQVAKRPKSIQHHRILTDILVKETPLKKQQVENYKRFKLQRLRSKSQMEISPGVMAIGESPRRSFYSAPKAVRSDTHGTFKTPPLKKKHLSPRVILNKEPSPAALHSLLHGEIISPALIGEDILISAQGTVVRDSPDLFESGCKDAKRATMREQSSSSRAARMLTYDTEDPLNPRPILRLKTPVKDRTISHNDSSTVSHSESEREKSVCFLTDLDPSIGNESASMMAFALSTPTKEDPKDFHQALQCIDHSHE